MKHWIFAFAALGMTVSGLSQGDFDLESALAECVDCADAEGSPVCVMIVEGEGVQVPNPCYAACLGFPTVGPWFCASDEGTGSGGDDGTGGSGDDGTGGGGEDGTGGGEDGTGGSGEDGTGGSGEDGTGGGEDGTGGEGESGTDSDEDGLTDQAESEWGTDANDPDTDGDGLTDGEEVTLFGTDPMLIDTDGNGRPDAVDLALDLMSQTQLCPSDINHDGVVSVGDMLVLLSDFSELCPN